MSCIAALIRRAMAPAARDGKNLLFVGRLAAVKGVPVLLDAMRALSPTPA